MSEPIELNEYGMAIWRHVNDTNLFVERSYRWIDRVIKIDERCNARRVVEDTEFSTFNFREWIPVTVEEFKKVKNYYKDIYVDWDAIALELECNGYVVRVKNIEISPKSLGNSSVNDGHDDLFDLGFKDNELEKYGLKIRKA